MMKRILLLLCLMLLLLTSVVGAAGRTVERVPLRVVQLPVLIESGMLPDEAVQDRLNRQVDRALHVPLNDTLQAVDFLDEAEVEAAYDEVTAEHGTKWRDVVKPLAQKLDADLVVVPILTGYEQWITYGGWYWDTGMILHSRASVWIVGYDAKQDEVFSKRASRFFDDGYSTAGEVSQLAQEAMDSALREAKLHERIGSWRTNTRPVAGGK